jgi:hypothetical protein
MADVRPQEAYNLRPKPHHRSILKHLRAKRAKPPVQPPEPADRPKNGDPGDALRQKHSRNRANTIRNSAKVEQFLIEVEKIQGFAKSWALRERLELGHVSLEEVMRR